MHVTVYSAHAFEQPFLAAAAGRQHELHFVADRLGPETVALAHGSPAVALFTSDDASAPVLERLAALGVRYVAVRAAGHDNVDLAAAARLGLRVAHVPEYSPYAIAEHTVALLLALNRRLRQADQQLRDYNFCLDNLVGFDLHGKTVGIVGCGRIGGVLAGILHGFGCHLLGYDVQPNPQLVRRYGLRYVGLDELCAQADIVTVHAPLTPQTRYLFDAARLARLKPGAMLLNTGRGGVLDTAAALAALRSGYLAYLGLDVYEHEKGLFFQDHSHEPAADPLLDELLAQPNVLVTGHQAFLTREALTNIADATVANLSAWAQGRAAAHELRPVPPALQPA
ncbi:2-hydroxyacid dehydrogenase [Hymenobacter sp. 15J16-1T3B]|uniref:2-hydroxyacid dehydrogenase n=1 Tax=Hymenobacter sp. 15J16-1T3B TaxID=2886941 RepID=UPI001D0F95F5|nr:2-hydroxyacid dehydrogenase [Hymenobacter sp. 15J16-1T3B]MCC3156691.1 2-hydroxyacid dehydrogenase [Hymenobacter sp. 15J16-1T3B]